MADQVLVIDDEKDAIDSLVFALRLKNITCRGETDPRTAIESFAANPTDIVIVDYVFPSAIGMTGIDVIARLQAIKPFTTFMLVSGWDSRYFDEKSLTAELRNILKAERFIHKPIDPEKLVDIVLSALQQIETQSTDWKAIAQEHVSKGTVNPEEVRELNEAIKKDLIDAVDKTRQEPE